ncbi:MAG: zinc dependent phospholipase C family protein [Bacteroidales bacterium]|nr:zinc dependent phospholipase C family protein [Bacteroidales bacterium]MCM1416401.1 zinc dependent phospholipase C family protein [bacterium]MCM1424158.1 zinc dependent phospholipase C family protein [bacterium]
MSLQMIHMEIAYRLLENLPQVQYPAELILGSVAPDAVHMAPQFDVERKIKSHLFTGCGPWGDTQDSEQWRRNIDAFFEKGVTAEKEPARRDFALGICIHCLTDHWNDIRIWKQARNKYLPSMEFDAFREFFYGEYRSIDWWLYQNGKNTAAIRKMLTEAAVFSVEGVVDLAELEKMRGHLLYEQYDVEKVDITSNRFLTKEQIEDFMSFTTEAIRKTLAEKGLH